MADPTSPLWPATYIFALLSSIFCVNLFFSRSFTPPDGSVQDDNSGSVQDDRDGFVQDDKDVIPAAAP